MNIAWKFKKQFGYKYGQDLINEENLFLKYSNFIICINFEESKLHKSRVV